MRQVTTFFFAALFASSSMAFDVWTGHKYGNEVVYSAGHPTKLYLGDRGVGMSAIQSLREEPVYVIVDNEPPVQFQTTHMGVAMLKLDNSQNLRAKIFNAKRVEIITRRYCLLECAFSLTGTTDDSANNSVWEFEKSLNQLIESRELEVIRYGRPD